MTRRLKAVFFCTQKQKEERTMAKEVTDSYSYVDVEAYAKEQEVDISSWSLYNDMTKEEYEALCLAVDKIASGREKEPMTPLQQMEQYQKNFSEMLSQIKRLQTETELKLNACYLFMRDKGLLEEYEARYGASLGSTVALVDNQAEDELVKYLTENETVLSTDHFETNREAAKTVAEEQVYLNQEAFDSLVHFGQTKFNGYNFNKVEFNETHLGIEEIKNASFYYCDFTNFDGRDIDMSDNFFRDTEIRNSTFENANFEKIATSYVRARGTNFEHANFEDSLLQHTVFAADSSLEHADFAHATFDTVYFYEGVVKNEPKGLEWVTVTMGGATNEEIKKHRKQVFQALKKGIVSEEEVTPHLPSEEIQGEDVIRDIAATGAVNSAGKRIIKQDEFDRVVAEGKTSFDNYDFSHITFSELHSGVKEITNSEFFMSLFTEFKGDNMSMHGNDIYSTAIIGSSFKNADFEGSSLVWSSIESTDLENASFKGSGITDITFYGANLEGATFEEVNLQKSSFIGGTDLTGVDFTSATLDAVHMKDTIVNAAPIGLDSVTFKVERDNEALEIYKSHLLRSLEEQIRAEEDILESAREVETDVQEANIPESEMKESDIQETKVQEAEVQEAEVQESDPATREAVNEERQYHDINESTARLANTMNSFRDYEEGSATRLYKKEVDHVYDIAGSVAEEKPDLAERATQMAERYSRRLAKYYNDYYRNEASCPSVMISGSANFPARKKEIQNSRRDALMEKLNYLQSYVESIENLKVMEQPILSSDANAIELLEEKLEKLEAAQTMMKAANAYYKKHGTLEGCPELTSEQSQEIQKEMTKRRERSPQYYNDKPFARLELTNNNAAIKNTEARLNRLKREKEIGTNETETSFFTMVENKELMRLQLAFEGKPEPAVREVLKKNGFRWSPKNGCWQRQLTDNARYSVKRVLQTLEEMAKEQTVGEQTTEEQTDTDLADTEVMTTGKTNENKAKPFRM